MESTSLLKINLCKLEAEIRELEEEIKKLRASHERSATLLESQKSRAISEAKSAFEVKKQQDIAQILHTCENMCERVEKLVDTFPSMKAQEYAGKYEIKGLENLLAEVYPRALLDRYICNNPILFQSEAEAYAAYTHAEYKIATLKSGTVVASIFTMLTDGLTSLCKSEKAGSKLAVILCVFLASLIVFNPLFLPTLFCIVGVIAALQGILVRRVLREVFSVKAYLNEVYDEDIFQADKQDIMRDVKAFLDTVRDDYVQMVESRVFRMNENILRDLERNAEDLQRKTEDRINAKQQELILKQKELATQLEEFDKIKLRQEEEAKSARDKFLHTVDWKYEWINQILLDVTADSRILGANWTKANSFYYSKDFGHLQQFWQLAIYQSMLKMPPDYCGQVVLDYKYMGSNLMQFSKVPASLLTICFSADAISTKIARMSEDIMGRVNNILKSCENIEQFNEMLSEYGSAGEAYVVVHICGLQSIDETLKICLRNGPKVGYFFKLYATSEEVELWKSDLPLDEFKEFCEVSDNLVPRTAATMRRILNESA